MSSINLIFSTPFFRGNMRGVEKLNKSLEQLILGLEDDKHRKADSPQPMHAGVFESEFDFLKRGEPEVRELKDLIYSTLGAFVKDVNQMNDADLSALKFHNHCWFHVMRDGGYFQPHNHPNASWSLCYYVSPGDTEPKNEKAAGHIVFDDPRPQAASYMDVAIDNMHRDLSYSPVRIRPEAGELVIFPSYLKHWVEPYDGDKPRISIAANFWFRK